MARSTSRDNINQRIALVGDDEVRRQFQQLGRAGEQALSQIDRAAAQSSGVMASAFARMRASFASIDSAIAPVGRSVASLGTQFRSVGGALTGLTPHINGFLASLTAVGAAFAAFKAAKDAALATDSLVDTAENLKITTEELAGLREVSVASGAAVDTLERAMQKGNKTLGEAVSKTQGFTTAVDQQVVALRGATPALNAAADAVEIVRGREKTLREEFAGTVQVLRGSGGLNNQIDEYATIARLLGVSLRDLAKMNPIERLKAEGKAIGLVKDETEQARLANAAWGKTYSEMLPILRELPDTLDPTIKRIRETKAGVNELEKAMSEGFLKAFAEAGTNLNAVFRFLGNTIGTLLVPVMREISIQISGNLDGIRAWATDVGQKAVPVVQDLIAAFKNLFQAQGEQQPLNTAFARGIADAFGVARQAIVAVIDIFRGLISAIDAMLVPINALFGTQMTGQMVLATAFVLQFIGAFGLLANIVLLVVNLGIAFAAIGALIAWPVVLTAALVALGTTLLATTEAWSNMKGTAQAFWDLILAFAGYVERQFVNLWLSVTATIAGAWTSLANSIGQQVQGILGWLNGLIEKARAVASAIAGAFGGGGAPAIPAPVFARGGPVIGPGTATSDSIVARLSAGEFVVNAFAASRFLPLLHAINSMRGFAEGGFVDLGASRIMPRSRGMMGGISGAGTFGRSGTPVNLHIGGERFPMRAEEDVATRLVKSARTRKLLRAGRAPSWVAG